MLRADPCSVQSILVETNKIYNYITVHKIGLKGSGDDTESLRLYSAQDLWSLVSLKFDTRFALTGFF